MTAPSQEAVSAIPDAEVRELVERISSVITKPRSFKSFRTDVGGLLNQYDGEVDFMTVKESRRVCEEIYSDLNAILPAIQALASRPTREEIRDEALEERIREDERDRILATISNIREGSWASGAISWLIQDGALFPASRTVLRSQTPAPSRNQDGET